MTAGAMVVLNVIGGVTGVIQSRAIGPFERGVLATAVTWPSVIICLVADGAPQVAAYFVARQPESRGAHACTTLALFGGISAVLATAGAGVVLLIGGPARGALLVAFATLPASTLIGVGTGTILGLEDLRGWSLLRLLGPSVTLIGVLVAIALGGRTALVIVGVIAISNVCQLAGVTRALHRRGLLARPRLGLVRPVVGYAWRNALNMGWIVSYQLDQLLLSIAVSPVQLGLYAVSASFGAVIIPIAAASGYVILPRIAGRGASEARRTLGPAIVVTAVTAGLACLALFVTGRTVIGVLFGTGFYGAVTSLRILMPGVVALALSSVLSDTLRGLGQPLVAARAGAVGALLTCALLAALIPPLGIRGAAIASSITYITVAAIMAWGVRRELSSGPPAVAFSPHPSGPPASLDLDVPAVAAIGLPGDGVSDPVGDEEHEGDGAHG